VERPSRRPEAGVGSGEKNELLDVGHCAEGEAIAAGIIPLDRQLVDTAAAVGAVGGRERASEVEGVAAPSADSRVRAAVLEPEEVVARAAAQDVVERVSAQVRRARADRAQILDVGEIHQAEHRPVGADLVPALSDQLDYRILEQGAVRQQDLVDVVPQPSSEQVHARASGQEVVSGAGLDAVCGRIAEHLVVAIACADILDSGEGIDAPDRIPGASAGQRDPACGRHCGRAKVDEDIAACGLRREVGHVVAVAADQHVASRPAPQDIVPASPVEPIGPGIAVEDVVRVAADEAVVEIAPARPFDPDQRVEQAVRIAGRSSGEIPTVHQLRGGAEVHRDRNPAAPAA
jgi:hypothetical protein